MTDQHPLERWVARFSAVASGLCTAALVTAGGLYVGTLIGHDDETAPSAAYTDLKPGAPVRLVVRPLRIKAPVVPIQLSSDAVLDPPRDVLDVGWWDASAKPGADDGQTVITGHTVHTGGGAMDDIDQLERGQRVDVVTKRGTMRYQVTKVKVLSKEQVATQAEALFGQDHGDGRLVLVSCDDFNGTFYESNVIVLARPLGQPVKKPAEKTQG